jgi:hypothetical protein
MKLDLTPFLELDFNKTQSTSLAWAERFSEWMNRNSWRGNGFFSPEIRIDCYCIDCKTGGQFLPDTTREFIFRHKSHNTKTMKVR